jgi:hypothetical protein
MESPRNQLETWKQQLAHWRESGLNGTTWCRERNIAFHVFQYWRKKIEGIQDTPKAGSGLSAQSFTELEDKSHASGIELECNGFVLRLSKCFDESTLKRFLIMLRKL